MLFFLFKRRIENESEKIILFERVGFAFDYPFFWIEADV